MFSVTALFLLLLLLLGQEPASALFLEVPCCSVFPHLGATFGPRLTFFSPGLRGTLSRALEGDEECAGALPGTIALVDRSDRVSFLALVRACQERGVLAVIVRNTMAHGGLDDLVRMGASEGDKVRDIRIPSIFVSNRAGRELDSALQQEEVVPIVQLYAADDVGLLYGSLLFLLPFLALIACTTCVCAATLRLSLQQCFGSPATTRRRWWSWRPRAMDRPFLVMEQDEEEGIAAALPAQAPPPPPQRQEEKQYRVVVGGGAEQEERAVYVTLVNGEPVFDQQEQ